MMPNIDAPFGLRPIQNIGSNYFNNLRSYPMADGTTQSTALYRGDPVTVSSGKIVRGNVNCSDIYGIFQGVSYYDADNVKQYRPYWPTGGVTGATRVMVSVYEDPNGIYEVQCVSGQTPAVTDIGTDHDLVGSGGSTVTGNSAIELNFGTGDALRILQIVDDPKNTWGEHARVVVKLTSGHHQLQS